jgi:hypothetical protein
MRNSLRRSRSSMRRMREATAAAALIRRLRLFSGMVKPAQVEKSLPRRNAGARRPREMSSDQDQAIDILRLWIAKTAKEQRDRQLFPAAATATSLMASLYYATMAIFRTATPRCGSGTRMGQLERHRGARALPLIWASCRASTRMAGPPDLRPALRPRAKGRPAMNGEMQVCRGSEVVVIIKHIPHTGPRVRAARGPRINSGRYPWRKWVC